MSGLELSYSQLISGNINENNEVIANVWTTSYNLIQRANAVVEAAPKISGDEIIINRFVGEARFLRAWTYFQLVTMWGPVPLYKSTSTTNSQGNPRSSVNDVTEFIIEDLKYAEVSLGITYSGNDIYRATKGAAQSLLGWVYLQNTEITKAREEFSKVINSNNYTLQENYMDNFLEETEYNNESIFEVGFKDLNENFSWGKILGNGIYIGESTSRNQFMSPTRWRAFIPSNLVVNEFENTKAGDLKTDPRLYDNCYFQGDLFNNDNDTIGKFDQGGALTDFHGESIKMSWKKYTNLYKSNVYLNPGGINFRMIRYGMLLLMMAECEIELGNINEGIGYLNQLRNRSSVQMPEYPTSKFPCNNKEEAFEAMMHEKMVETAGEDIRNFDILRWRKANKFAIDPIYNYSSNMALLPIPYEEIINNPNIGSQNPGY